MGPLILMLVVLPFRYIPAHARIGSSGRCAVAALPQIGQKPLALLRVEAIRCTYPLVHTPSDNPNSSITGIGRLKSRQQRHETCLRRFGA